ncbi:MAG: glycosyltransferase [Romboutsia sp.]|uniref:glycosyltransferase n=1 Tax=Romboutsia sp. TaxID=1965302 RepID=UPI003F346DAA
MSHNRKNGLISVIVTNYNNENYISDCLDGILNQSYKNIEIIVIDDASTDNSLSVIKNWINLNKNSFSNDDFFTLIELPRNTGFSGAVTAGLFACKGEFIAFHDGDDLSNKNRFKKQVEFLNMNTHLNSVGCNYSIFSNSDLTPVFKPNGIVCGVEKIKNIYSKGGNCVCYGTLLFRGEIFDTIGGLNRRLPLVEDYEYITRLLPFGLDNLPDILYYYRKHEKQRSRGLYTFKDKPHNIEDFKVLMVLDKLNIGGTETHVLSLIKGLLANNIQVAIVAGKGPLKSEFEKLGCNIYEVDFPLTIETDVLKKSEFENMLNKIIDDESINIVHAHQSPSGSICIDLCNKLKIPCVFTIHGLYYQDIVDSKLKLAQEVISVSPPVYEWLLEFGINSTIVPNFIDFNEFFQFDNEEDIRNELDIDKDAFIALYCSRLAWGKTLVAENLIRVCRDIRRLENIDIHAIIVGEGPDLHKISYCCDRANNILKDNFIHVVGPKTVLNDYYASCDCVVGTGRVAIEAMASYKPVIASGNLGYLGILNEDNLDLSWQTYFADHKFNKVNNASYLYKDLKHMISNKNKFKDISNTCSNWAKEKFDTDTNIKDIIKIYQRSVSNCDYFFKK